MGRVVHFEIPAGDTKRAVDFYGKAFGWKFEKWPGPMEYWLVSTGDAAAPGINGGTPSGSAASAATRSGRMQSTVSRRWLCCSVLPSGSTVKSTTNTIQVDSVDTAAAAVKSAGGKQLSPKNAIPGVGYFAYCEDTEGNVFGVMQNDTSAK